VKTGSTLKGEAGIKGRLHEAHWFQVGTQWDEHEKTETWMLGYGGEVARRARARNWYLLRSTCCLLASWMCIRVN